MALRLLLLRPPVHSAARCLFVAPALADTPALFSCYPSTTHAHSRNPNTLPHCPPARTPTPLPALMPPSLSIVPNFVTSNSFIACCYAKLIMGYLRDYLAT